MCRPCRAAQTSVGWSLQDVYTFADPMGNEDVIGQFGLERILRAWLVSAGSSLGKKRVSGLGLDQVQNKAMMNPTVRRWLCCRRPARGAGKKAAGKCRQRTAAAA